ncbi:MAG TPA: hypothetical protein ENJ34_00495 [Epsilonproteobacteria bacterium]|nr:hypothetical protein [Campylobacterota bacterium]
MTYTKQNIYGIVSTLFALCIFSLIELAFLFSFLAKLSDITIYAIWFISLLFFMAAKTLIEARQWLWFSSSAFTFIYSIVTTISFYSKEPNSTSEAFMQTLILVWFAPFVAAVFLLSVMLFLVGNSLKKKRANKKKENTTLP